MILLALLEFNFQYIGYATNWNSQSVSIALLVGSSMVVSEVLYNVLRVKGEFVKIGIMEVLLSVICLLIVINETNSNEASIYKIFLYFFVLNTLLVIYQLKLLSPLYEFTSMSLVHLRKLLGTGFNMQAVNFSVSVLLTLGHYTLASKITAYTYGIFSFGASIAIFTLIGAQSYIWMNYSKALSLWSAFYNDKSKEERIAAIMHRYQLLLVVYIVTFFLLIYFLSGFFITLLFPKFIESRDIIGLMFSIGSCHLLIFYELAFLIQNKKYKAILFPVFISITLYLGLVSAEENVLKILGVQSFESVMFHPLCLLLSNIYFILSIFTVYTMDNGIVTSFKTAVNQVILVLIIISIALFFVSSNLYLMFAVLTMLVVLFFFINRPVVLSSFKFGG